MSEPSAGTRLPYLPALDGLRGLAVAAVLLFHADFTWARGGHLGVTTFFTLSGFLITALLLVEKDGKGTIGLRAFWARRARRLVPAIIISFALIAVVVALMPGAPPNGLVGDALSASTWVANWRFVFAGRTYADLFSTPSPFQHFWSLAVEEQFYVLFPLLTLFVLGRRTMQARRKPFAAILVLLVVFSTIQAARLHPADGAIARAYYGTDARMAEILVGALLALALIGPRGIRTLGTVSRRIAMAVGVLGLGGLGVAYVRLGDHANRLYQGGFLAVALCTAAVIAASTQPGSVLGRALSTRPAVALGKISYGAYLFHWPIFILLSQHRTGLSPAPLFAIRAALTLGLAGVSYVLIESPIRHGRMPADLALPAWASGAVAGIASIALVAWQAPVVTAASTTSQDVGSSVSSRAAAVSTPGIGGARATSSVTVTKARAKPVAAAPVRKKKKAPPPPAAPTGFVADPKKPPPPPTVPVAPSNALRVTMVGDSLGLNLGNAMVTWAKGRKDVVVQNLAVSACPISRGGERRYGTGDPFPISEDCLWWDQPSSDRYKAMVKFKPQVIVLQDGANEIFDRKLPDWSDWRHNGDFRYDSWLKNEYQTAFSRWISSYAAKLVVTNAPCGDFQRYQLFPRDASYRVRELNSSEYGSGQDFTVADLFDRICPNGQFNDNVEGVQDGRPDGYHFSSDAALALVRNWLGPIALEAGAQPATTPSPSPQPFP